MSTYLSSVPAVLKLNHSSRDSYNLEDVNRKPYTIPLKQYQGNHSTPTLGDLLRGADTITSITFNSSVLSKFSDSNQDITNSHSHAYRESPLSLRNTPISGTGEITSYTNLLTSSANARPCNKSAGSLLSQNQGVEDGDSITEEMKLKGKRCKMKDTTHGTKDLKSNNRNKGRKSRRRSKSALGRGKGQSVVDRLYQSAHSNGTKTPVGNKHEIEIKPKSQPDSNGLNGLGAMQITLCKPLTIHNNRPDRRDVKSEVPRKTVERESTATSAKTMIQTKDIDISKETVTLPQMVSNSPVKSITQTDIFRKTNNYFLPSTHKLPVHVGGAFLKNQNNSDNSTKVTKIYLSDKHSGTLKDCGIEIPCAPPATPTPEQLKKVEYVPSLNDIRSQRAVKVKLQVLEKEAQKRVEKERDEREKIEKQNKKLMEKDLKHQQRLEIYALNKVMTELENARFKEFCAKKGIKTS